MSSLLENMKRTTQAVVDGYSKWEIEAVMAPRADNCIHHILPKSLGRQPKSNKEYREYFTTVRPIFHDFEVTVENQVYDVGQKKGAFHLFSKASTPIGPYGNEYSFFLTFNDDGTKFVYMEEMVDSAYSAKFFGQLQEWVKNNPENETAKAWGDAVATAYAQVGAGKK